MKEYSITCICAKWVKSESDEIFGSCCHFSGNTENRRMYWSAPWVCSQQNLNSEKLYRPNVLCLSTNKLPKKRKHRVGMNRLKETKYIWNALVIKTIVSKDTHMNNKIVNENKEWFHCAKTDSCYFGR